MKDYFKVVIEFFSETGVRVLYGYDKKLGGYEWSSYQDTLGM